MFWLVIGLFSFLLALLGSKRSKYQYVYRALLIITLAIPIGLGGTSSRDHDGYARNYNNMSTRSVTEIVSNYDLVSGTFSQREETYEVGFTVLIVLINKLGFTEAAFFMIIALITSSLYVSFFYRFKNVPFIILIFLTSVYYSHQANLVRQMMAVTLFLFSIEYLSKATYRKYIFLVLLASIFHTSALLLLLFTPFRYVEKESNTFWSILLGIWIVTIPLAIHVININLFSFMPSVLNYTISIEDSRAVGTVIDFDVVYNFFVLLFFLLRKYISNEYVKYGAFFVVGGILLNISQQMMLIYRFALYFAPLICVFIPNIVNINAKGWKIQEPLKYIVLAYYIYIYSSSLIFSANPLFTNNMYGLSDLF